MLLPAPNASLPSTALRARRGLVLSSILSLLVAIALYGEEHMVETTEVGFVPAQLTIQVGDTVTWVNVDSGAHSVVAIDGTFDSGVPSSDPWQYSFTFHEGGTWDYTCSVHFGQGPTHTIIVEGIFGDDMETGDATAWSAQSSQLPNCHCYFSGDCAGAGEFCNWGILTEENNCLWRENKPNGVPGAGCDVDFPGVDWTSGICDGICTQSSLGSTLGLEDKGLVARGVQMWAEALLQPAEAGGGEIDPELSAQALTLPFDGGEHAAWILGRQVGDLLGTLGVEGIDHQYCHYESHPGEPSPTLPDLSSDLCMANAARLAIDALVAEIYQPGSAYRVLDNLGDCEQSSLHTFRKWCPAGADNMTCAARRIAAAAELLSTAPPRSEARSRP